MLERFGQMWNALYQQTAKSWTIHWSNLRAIYEYSPEIRKAIYTTNAIESLNSVIRAATKHRNLPQRRLGAQGDLFGHRAGL